MLKNRIKKVEDKMRLELSSKKKLKIWTISIDQTNPEIKDTDKEAQRLIDEIETKKTRNNDKSFYSEDDAHFFIIRIITNDRNKVESFE
jgi:hypothetical protein